MIGLLIKDWQLMKRQARYYGIVALLACAMCFAAGSRDYSSFITSYLTFMISMYSISSFTYDEYENGMAFLMALPCGRRDYVREKYLFSFLLITGGWLIGILLRLLFFLIRFSAAEYLEQLPGEPVYLLLCLMYVGCTIPILIKYGVEKGRGIAFGALAILAVGVFSIAKCGILKNVNRLSTLSPAVVLSILLTACVLILGIAYVLSVRMMEKKEF